VKCSGDVQLHAVSRLLEAKPCAWGTKHEPLVFAPCMIERSAQYFHVQLVPCGVPFQAGGRHAKDREYQHSNCQPWDLSVWPRAAQPATPTHHLNEYMHGSGQFGTVVRSNP
jgi:hypothetical protein